MPGNAPFGYRYSDGNLVPEDEEQETIALIQERRKPASSDGKPLSFGSIAAMLNREGRLNRGKFWNPTMLWYIVRREAKKGEESGSS